MDPTEFYRQIVESIREEDVHAVAGVMAGHVGEENLITLEDLAIQAFGEYNASTERKTREILEKLTTEHHLPVCANSGRSGRWLARDAAERDKSAGELERRGNHTLDRARALRMAVVPAKTLKRERQQSLWR
ncbi:MAG TPA: hypothetical protein VFF68_10105 [Anaerolineaceae bacterium]|nr:hypothetical protein [Anaerolineaceae bacterium]